MHIQPNQQTDILQCILQRLDNVDQKLGQLNSIQKSVIDITSRLNSMELKMNGTEKSRRYISDQYDTLSTCTDANEKNIECIRKEVKLLKSENSKLQIDNASMNESVIYLKSRSMRDNFFWYSRR